MRTQWTTKENRDAGFSCSYDRGLHRYLRNFEEGGLNTPNHPQYATAHKDLYMQVYGNVLCIRIRRLVDVKMCVMQRHIDDLNHVFWFSTSFVWTISHSKNIQARYDQIGLHANYLLFLLHCNGTSTLRCVIPVVCVTNERGRKV